MSKRTEAADTFLMIQKARREAKSMAHSSMYQLANELRQQVYELKGEETHYRWKAEQLENKRLNKQKFLDDLTEQIANVEKYEAEQRELASKD